MEYEVQILGSNHGNIGELAVTDEGIVVELIGNPDEQGVVWVQETDEDPAYVEDALTAIHLTE